MTEHAESPLTMDDIIAAVCGSYNVPVDVLLSPRRATRVSRVRHTAVYLCERLLAVQQKDIAERFSRDRSMISYAVNAIEEVYRSDPSERARIKAIADALVPGCAERVRPGSVAKPATSNEYMGEQEKYDSIAEILGQEIIDIVYRSDIPGGTRTGFKKTVSRKTLEAIVKLGGVVNFDS